MAGMEIFGWLGFLLTVTMAVFTLRDQKTKSIVTTITIGEWFLFGFLMAVILGALLNSPEGTDRLFVIGRARGVLLLVGLKILILSTFDKKTEKTFYVLFAIATIASLNAFYQYFSGVDLVRASNEYIEQMTDKPPYVFRTIGFFNSSMTFANSMAALLTIPFAFCLVNPRRTKLSRFLFGLVTLLMALAIVTSFTRGAWIGALSSILIIAFLKEWKVFAVTAAVIVGIIFTAIKIHPALEIRARTTFDAHTKSAKERIELWRANFSIFKDYPLLGIGYGENERVIENYYQKNGVISGFDGHAHSNFFQFLSGTGALGTLCFYLFAFYMLAMNIQLWFKLRNNRDWITAFVLGALGTQITMHVSGITECNFKDMEINHLFVFVFAMLLAIRYKVNVEKANTAEYQLRP